MVLKKIVLILLIAPLALADTGFKSTLQFTETDNSPTCQAGRVMVSAGSLTCDGQTAVISTGSNGVFSIAGYTMTDPDGCTWQTTIDTSGHLITTLQSCFSLTFPGIYLVDALGGQWSVTVSAAGALVKTQVTSIPNGEIAPHQLVTQDKNFKFWTISINSSGTLSTALGGGPSQAITDVLLSDPDNKTWVLTVNTSGGIIIT